MNLKYDLYLSSQPCTPLPPGGELLYAGQYEVEVPEDIAQADHQTRMRNLEADDTRIVEGIFEMFRNDPPATYAGHTLSAGDVLTFFEGGFKRSYMLLHNGMERLRHAIYGAEELKSAMLFCMDAHYQELIKISTVYGQYKITISLVHGRLSPKAGDFTFPAA